MTAEHLLLKAMSTDVKITPNGKGGLEISGNRQAIDNLLPEIRPLKAEIISFLMQPPVETLLKPCPICQGRDFVHGHKGGFFCIECQPGARPADPVRAGRE